MAERVAITGSRDYPNPTAAVAYALGQLPEDTIIVQGGARGIDRAAKEFADKNFTQRPVTIWADWDQVGKLAGKQRNWDIVKMADRVIAFWDGTSNGTAHAIAAAVRFKKPVTIWMPGDS